MTDYIDREAAIKAVNWQSAITMTRAAMTYAIKSIPAADVVEVVRCRDCKHYDRDECYHPRHEKHLQSIFQSPDDFCSYGERREAGT